MPNNKKRDLPECVLKRNITFPNLEAESVQRKYSMPASEVGEENVDYAALTYLSPEASLFWLPQFLDYVQYGGRRESYHFEVLIQNLSEPDFVRQFYRLATIDEVRRVLDYLEWLKEYLSARDFESIREEREQASVLWRNLPTAD